MRRLMVVVAAVVVIGAGCGSSSKSSSGSASTTSSASATVTSLAAVISTAGDAARQTVLTETIAQGTKAGVELDHDCVSKLVALLSDADAMALAGSTTNTAPGATQPKLSTAGEQLGQKILTCSKGSGNNALIEAAAKKVLSAEGGSSLDPQCVTKQLATLTDATLQLVIDSGPDATGDQLSTVGYLLLDCVTKTTTS